LSRGDGLADGVFSSSISIDTQLCESPVVGQPLTRAAEWLQFVSEWTL
jgi:hypothetical protein